MPLVSGGEARLLRRSLHVGRDDPDYADQAGEKEHCHAENLLPDARKAAIDVAMIQVCEADKKARETESHCIPENRAHAWCDEMNSVPSGAEPQLPLDVITHTTDESISPLSDRRDRSEQRGEAASGERRDIQAACGQEHGHAPPFLVRRWIWTVEASRCTIEQPKAARRPGQLRGGKRCQP